MLQILIVSISLECSSFSSWLAWGAVLCILQKPINQSETCDSFHYTLWLFITYNTQWLGKLKMYHETLLMLIVEFHWWKSHVLTQTVNINLAIKSHDTWCVEEGKKFWKTSPYTPRKLTSFKSHLKRQPPDACMWIHIKVSLQCLVVETHRCHWRVPRCKLRLST